MTSIWAVGVVALLQVVLRISFFIEQNSDACSSAPTLASWIFLIAFLDVLLDSCVYPVRYMHLPHICQIAAETVVAVFLAEFGTLVVWCKIEKVTCKLCKTILLLIGISPKFYYLWKNYILGIATTSISLIILLAAAQATDHLHFMRKRSIRLCRKINSKSLEVWNKLRSLRVPERTKNCETLTNCITVPSVEILYNRRRSNNKRSRSRSKGSRSRTRKRS